MNPTLIQIISRITGNSSIKASMDTINDPTTGTLGISIDKRLKLEKALIASAKREYYLLQLRRPLFYLLHFKSRFDLFIVKLRILTFCFKLQFSYYIHYLAYGTRSDCDFWDNYYFVSGKDRPNFKLDTPTGGLLYAEEVYNPNSTPAIRVLSMPEAAKKHPNG